MPRTPDRFPGERQDEGIILFDNATAGDPSDLGGLRFITDRFRFRDVLGVYTGRPVYVTTVDPTATDDTTSGYEAGMLWLNTTTGDRFLCRDSTPTAAVWDTFGGLPTATETGQHLISLDGSTFERALPVVSPDDGWLSNCAGDLLVEGITP